MRRSVKPTEFLRLSVEDTLENPWSKLD